MDRLKFRTEEELNMLMENAHDTAKLFPEIARSDVTVASGLNLKEANQVEAVIADVFNKQDNVVAKVRPEGFAFKVVMYVNLLPEELEEILEVQKIVEEDLKAEEPVSINELIKDWSSSISSYSEISSAHTISDEEIDKLWKEHLERFHEKDGEEDDS